ncbi:hypothetical protein PTSG_01316 [Salpingoeca rosetta]|uniref:THUMP domain-containing protein n=1 Tax=Salpingoeca rosetta (strain ATCC 50818 / BSB-021) TaxID=946362 RepID=F2TZZ8_SALR5|nr:uncharacterized protein PTSG_01316 [Salpingoeca rosetta]EGD80726.1 hypothetical protein PTSG_01316 [Salpingoeca rosetta]|eukprot:XP_004997287.1 hypothetical protein PTSG_01316 [Salpingoeca rosetta]
MLYALSTNSGLEGFAAQEVESFLGASDVNTTESFVRFTSECQACDLLNLRTVERAFAGLACLDDSVMATFKERDATECMELIADAITPKAAAAALAAWRNATQNTSNSFEPSFRVSCKRIGGRSKHLRSTDIAAHVGISMRNKLGWRVDLKSYDMEVYVRVEDTFVFVGISLSEQRLTDRKDIVVEGLRGSAAYALAMMAEPRPGDVILDPMCGKGALLFEAHRLCPAALLVGTDMSNAQLRAAAQNAIGTRSSHQAALFKGDARMLPLESASIDRIVCDLPFGKKFGSAKDNRDLYPAVLRECTRVLRPSGRAVLLTSKKQLTTLLTAVHGQELHICRQQRFKLGNTESTAVVVRHRRAGDPVIDPAEAALDARARRKRNKAKRAANARGGEYDDSSKRAKQPAQQAAAAAQGHKQEHEKRHEQEQQHKQDQDQDHEPGRIRLPQRQQRRQQQQQQAQGWGEFLQSSCVLS